MNYIISQGLRPQVYTENYQVGYSKDSEFISQWPSQGLWKTLGMAEFEQRGPAELTLS